MRSPTRARLALATLVCAAAMALAGCGSSSAPPIAGNSASTSGSPTPSPSTSPTSSVTTAATPTPSPSPSATTSNGDTVTKGGAAKGPAADAAKKVAQAFIAADNVSTKTGRFAARDKVTASSCAWCATKRAFVNKIYTGGGHIEGELFTKNTFTVAGPTNGVYTVVVNTTVSKYKEINGSGKVLDSRGDRDGLLALQVSSATSNVVAASWQPGA